MLQNNLHYCTEAKDRNERGGDPGGGRGGVKKVGRTRKKVTEISGSAESPKAEYHCWLMKSEPESRMEKGMDMKVGAGVNL